MCRYRMEVTGGGQLVAGSSCVLRDSGVIWKSESKKRQMLSTLDARLSTLHFGKIMGNMWQGWEFFNHGLPGWARI